MSSATSPHTPAALSHANERFHIRRMRPLPFQWPYWPAFWIVFVWSFLPEYRIVRDARNAMKTAAASPDAGSVRVITIGMQVASVVAFGVAFIPVLLIGRPMRMPAYVAGIALIVAGSLLRRHCWKQLGASFTGDVRARPDQQIVTTGAYAILRHPSYTAGLLMNLGIGLALGSWASVAVLVVTTFVVYGYRISVEERTLATTIGEPYREFMRTRRRMIPFVY